MQPKLSIIIAFYNSHGVIARQVKYFHSLNLPDDIEFVLVDDGSLPAHRCEDYDLKNFRLHHTNDTRAWTQGLARNAAAELARGEYLLMTDADHILSREAIMAAYNFTGEKMVFPRYFGVLLEDGALTQDIGVLEQYGLQMERLQTKRGLYASVHGNTFCMKRSIFHELGGYEKGICSRGYHQKDDGLFLNEWNKYANKIGVQQVLGPHIYIFPIARYHARGDKNPLGLFHGLSHEQTPQPPKGVSSAATSAAQT